MRKRLGTLAAVLAVGAMASPAFAQGGSPGVPVPPGPPPSLALTDHLASTSIAVNTGTPVVNVADVRNNSASPQTVTVTYSQVGGGTGACAMPSWSAPALLVKPGSSATSSTKVPAPSCPGDYTLLVSASSTSGISAEPVSVVFSQYLKLRNH
jgi:hypothetical protein